MSFKRISWSDRPFTYYTAAHMRKDRAMTRSESSNSRLDPIVKKNLIKSTKWFDNKGASYRHMSTHTHPLKPRYQSQLTNINNVSNTSKISPALSSSPSVRHCSKTLTIPGIMFLNDFYCNSHMSTCHTAHARHTQTYNVLLIVGFNEFSKFAQGPNIQLPLAAAEDHSGQHPLTIQ